MSVSLIVNGVRYGGWKEIRIERSMETLSGQFSLGISERWPGQQQPRDINPGDRCVVKIDNDTVITGFVDDVNPSYDAESHQVEITGRDAAGDLVDCSAMNKPGQWSGLRIDAIIKQLIAPFAIPLAVEADTGEAFKKFAIEQGETVHEAIQRLCKLRALLCISDGHGGLVLTVAGTRRASTALIQGENILSANSVFSWKDRFSQITVKGQTQGSDDKKASINTGPKGKASDSQISRYRPLLITAEGQANTKICQERAAWEVANRKAKGTRVSVTVAGWRQGDSTLWDLNSRVLLRSPWLKTNGEMLIVGIAHTLSESGGSITELELAPVDAYKLIREPAGSI